MRRRSFVAAGFGLVVPVGFGTPPASAERFPERPIRVVVPWPAGGIVDVITRTVTTSAAVDFGTAVEVDNDVGADGAIGTESVADSAPDGYTWLIGTLTTLTAPYVIKGISIDALERFSGVAMLASSSLVAVVPAKLPVSSLKEFVAWGKAQGTLRYLNPGKGSASYLNTEILKEREHLNLEAVDYNGQPIGIPDLVLGHLQFGLIAPALAHVLVEEARLKPLAVAFPRRVRQFPNVPTFSEAGFPEIDVVASFYVLVPKRTPAQVIGRISSAIEAALADSGVRSKIEASGAAVLAAMTPHEVEASLVADNQRWNRFFKGRHIVPE